MATVYQSVQQAVRFWYIPLLLGLFFIGLGVYIFTVPLEAYLALSLMFGIYFIVSGASDIFFALQNSEVFSHYVWYLVGGVASLIIGIYLTADPGVSMMILPVIVAFALMFRSFTLLGLSFGLRNAGFLLLSMLGIIVSTALLAHPILTGISLVLLTACSFIVVGVSSVFLSFNMKKHQNNYE